MSHSYPNLKHSEDLGHSGMEKRLIFLAVQLWVPGKCSNYLRNYLKSKELLDNMSLYSCISISNSQEQKWCEW